MATTRMLVARVELQGLAAEAAWKAPGLSAGRQNRGKFLSSVAYRIGESHD